MFVRLSFGVTKVIPDAGKSWDASRYKHRTTDAGAGTIPRGVPVYWELPSVADHVALSLGDGWCLSNDILRRGRIDRVRIDTITRTWGGRLLGWTDDLNGVLIREVPVVKPLRVDLVDISHHQSYKIDWAAAKKAGVKGVYHKATEGASFKDSSYAARRVAAAAARMPFGAYHFARPGLGDAASEARHFLAVAKPKPGDLAPMLDLEDTGGLTTAQLTTWVGVWVATVQKACKVRPIIYTPFNLGSHHGCPLWVARYHNGNAEPKVPAPWDRWDVRQFSNGTYGVPKRITGFPGPTDLNTLRAGFVLPRVPKSEPDPPKPPTPPAVLERVAVCNMRVTVPDKPAGEGLRRVCGVSDVVAALESGGRMDVLRAIPGWTWLRGAGAPPVGVRAGRYARHSVESVTLAKGRRVNPLPGRRTRLPDMNATVVVTHDGSETVGIIATHFPASVESGGVYKRIAGKLTLRAVMHRQGRTALRKHAETLAATCDRVYVMADTNFHLMRFLGAPRLVSCWDGRKPVGTHGKRTIDIVYAWGRKAASVRTIPTASDHDAVVATYDVA
jgi:GH25 family lysozyme M1 (1,4-beta-N-acetylmuramidase)